VASPTQDVPTALATGCAVAAPSEPPLMRAMRSATVAMP
jgi:hypothetical protein